MRFEIAKRKLLTTDDTIEKIALDIGFSDKSHFIKGFKKYFGVSPGCIHE
ncbi:helix-turn-helix domain-containing protein [Halosquirtibacter laminarini]|uniref:Helix-turn-helix domain-containing protein n=1 Tax=Halosquirtibacter laminarini TaxID=3374600 RepID=A0AC61NNT6_9BACT|nr:helix-turn-helix domain-containing protein [Prolixibacteraceae bacterium]